MIYQEGLLSNEHAAAWYSMLHKYARETCEQGPTVTQGGFHNGGREERRGCSVSLIMYWAPVRATPGHDPEQQILRVVSADIHNYAAERKMCCRPKLNNKMHSWICWSLEWITACSRFPLEKNNNFSFFVCAYVPSIHNIYQEKMQ